MDIGFIGLGKMGLNMTKRLHDKGYRVVASDINEDARTSANDYGIETFATINDMIQKLPVPRVVWMMVPSGDIAQNVIEDLEKSLQQGDVVINGGNEFYENTVRHAEELQKREIALIDVGVSGGQEGARHGACLMIGGMRDVYERYEDLFRDLAAKDAFVFFEGNGAGHYVKMVHNGIEYGMMQSLAEGFDVLKNAPFSVSLKDAAHVYNKESIVASRLTGWLSEGFDLYGEELSDISGSSGSGGAQGLAQSEAAWTRDEAKKRGVHTPVIRESLDVRCKSQEEPCYQGRMINVMRHQFGGHDIIKK